MKKKEQYVGRTKKRCRRKEKRAENKKKVRWRKIQRCRRKKKR